MGKRKKKKKKNNTVNTANDLTKEEAVVIAKTYVHNPTVTTPATISDKDVVSKYLKNVTILIGE